MLIDHLAIHKFAISDCSVEQHNTLITMNYKLIAVTLSTRRSFKCLITDDTGELQCDYKRDANFLCNYALAQYSHHTRHLETSLDLSNHRKDYLLMTDLSIYDNKFELTLIIIPAQLKTHIDTIISTESSIRTVCVLTSNTPLCTFSVVSSDDIVPLHGERRFSEVVNNVDELMKVTIDEFKSMKTLHDIVFWTHNPTMLTEIKRRTHTIANEGKLKK